MPTEVILKTRRGGRVSRARIRARGTRMLRALRRPDEALCIVLTSDREIRRLNAAHRGEDRPTDVLAFPAGDPIAPGAPALLGDVVISIETAARQARARRATLLAEVTFLLAHGMLHLVGLDHRTDDEEARMDGETARLVRAASRGEGSRAGRGG